jgi:hypothetical protein
MTDRMPDVAIPQEVQQLGQPPTPEEIGEQIEMLARRAAEARRTVLQCDLEIAKLLALLTDQHDYKGRRFSNFALEHGVGSRTDAYDLAKLADQADEIVAEHAAATQDDPRHEWPSWRQVWSDIKRTKQNRYWLTPPNRYAELDAEFRFDYDPCPYPRPDGFDSLAEDVEWGTSNYVNAPFRQDDVVGGRGPTAFLKKGIEQQQKGKTSVFVLPVHDYVTKLPEAGAEVRSMGRLPFLDVVSGEPAKHPANIACFILYGHKRRADQVSEVDEPKQSADALREG